MFNISNATNESCLGACNGSVLVDSLVGGSFPYSALLTDIQTGLSNTYNILNDSIVGVCSGDYIITLTDVNNCPSVVMAGGVDHQVVDYDTYTEAQIDVQSSDIIICNASLDGILTVLDPSTLLGYTYSWQDIDGNIVSNSTTAEDLSSGIYILYSDYDNTDGCTTTDTVEIVELPALTNTVSIIDVDCYGDSTGSIAAVPANGQSPYTYNWLPFGGSSSTAINLQAGTYTVTIADNQDCFNSFTYLVEEPEELEVVIDNTSFLLEVSDIEGGVQPFTYDWQEQTIGSLNTGALSYTASSIGSYSLEVTDANGCVGTSNMISFGTTAVAELGLDKLNIYPNPFVEETTIDFGREIKEATITLLDVYGKVVEEYNINNVDKYIIKRNSKASGVYFIEIEIEDNYLNTAKLIID